MGFSDAAGHTLSELLSQESCAVEDALLLLSGYLQGTQDPPEQPYLALDRLAEDVASPQLLEDLVHALFVTNSFTGDIENYHAEENSFLDRVLDRRLGMPISLAAVVVAVGRRVGLRLHLIGLPGHVVVGVDDDPSSFVDAFAGSIVDRSALERRVSSIFGEAVQLTEDMLTPLSPLDVVTRVSNNLLRTWEHVPHKVDRLLELNVLLPLKKSDQRRIAQLAEARGRFDIAARLRSSIDPHDPAVTTLWSKLN